MGPGSRGGGVTTTTGKVGKVVGSADGAPLTAGEGLLITLAPGVPGIAADADGEAPARLGAGGTEAEGATDGSGVVPQLAIRLPITKRATIAARTTNTTPTSGRRDFDGMEVQSV